MSSPFKPNSIPKPVTGGGPAVGASKSLPRRPKTGNSQIVSYNDISLIEF